MNPLTSRWGAAMRPQSAVAIGVAVALFASWSTAEAGRRGHRSKRSRAHAPAKAAPSARQETTPAPAASAAPDTPPRPGVQDAPAPSRGKPPARPREKVFDFTGLELSGSERMPQLLYFLDRAEQELERASLERRSFVPAMMRSIDEEDL